MTSKLKCPYCQTELEQMHDRKMFGCPNCLHIADGALWIKDIRLQKDLKRTKKQLKTAKQYFKLAMDRLNQLEN